MPKSDKKRFDQTDAFTGEVFKSHVEDHYEVVDSTPFAPPVEIARPTVRQRVENLLNRGVDPLAHYVGAEGLDMEVPDDPEAPLTPSEENYLDILAAEVAEASPLPDEGIPRPEGVLAPSQPLEADEGGSKGAGSPNKPDPQTPPGEKSVPT